MTSANVTQRMLEMADALAYDFVGAHPGSAINNLRYLHCSLCNSEWNVTRATCTACDTDITL